MAEEVIGLLFGVAGGGQINGASGKLIVEDLTQIVNDINAGKSTIPKIKLDFDATEITNAVNDLKSKLEDIKKLASIKISQGGQKQSSQKSNSTQEIQKQIEKYRELSNAIKKWTQDSKTAAKLAAEYSGISRDFNGHLEGSAPNYGETIDSINKTVDALSKLKFAFATAEDVKNKLASKEGELIRPNEKDFAEVSSAIGITREQYEQLFTQMKTGSTTAAQNVQNANRKATNDTAKQIRNVSQQIDRMYDTISKNSTVKKMADELRKYMASGSVDVGELKNRFDAFTNAAVESGAAIETWGDKFKKTFAGKVRSALAAAITTAFTKYLRDIYQNVVNIDKALVNLQIASGKTREETKTLIKEYSTLAKQLGATTVEVADAADTWLRQGYSTKEANTLITNSMMLSKLGQIDSAEASKALTSAMKGYGVAVEDSVKIVDKLTKVDMEAAASAGDIATAMAETATSAKLSGVSMDELIGYITTVKEVTQDGSESVGVFFKTLFARMNNVKAGKFIDDETGEALNDVESVLHKLDIELRGANDEFRNSSDVLGEVAARWDKFNDTERNAIATAMAGSRQFEKFNVLMSNYSTAMGYATTATESHGTAVEKFSAFTEGIEGKMNSLKATFEELSMTLLNSDFLAYIVDFFAFLIEGLTVVGSVVKALGGLPTVLLAVASALLLVNGGLMAFNAQQAILVFIKKLKSGLMSIVDAIPSAIAAWNAYRAGVVSANTAIQASIPVIGLVLAATTLIITTFKAFASSANATTRAKKKLVDDAKESKEALEEVQKELDEVNNRLDESKKRLSELQSLSSSGKITLVEQQELNKLSQAVTKLEAEKQTLEDIAVLKQQEASKDAVDALKGIQGEKLLEGTNVFKNTHVVELLAKNYKIEDGTELFKMTAEDYVNAILSDWEYAIETEEHLDYIIEYYEQLKEQADMLTYYAGENLEQWQKDCNDAYNSYYEFTHKLLVAQGNFKTAWDSVITMERFDGIQDTLKSIAEQGNLTAENIQSLYNSNDKLKELIDYLVSVGYFSWDSQDAIRGLVNQINSMATSSQGVSVPLKSAYDILNEVQKGYDGLVDALANVTSEGYLTGDALATLFELEKDNALGGLQLSKILHQDANGYKLADDALQQYVQALIAANTIEGEFATQEDRDNAIANLINLQSVLAAVTATQEEAVDASKVRREELEKEQDMYEDQLDKFEELIDLRKDLLQTYKEELDYQKELEKRQRNVTALQTRLSVARLDQSAAGQARVRELEAELKEAQDELDDFTLEHAIDVLTDQLDSTNAEWKSIIQSKLDEITGWLEKLDTTPEVNITTDTSWAQEFLAQITELIAQYKPRWTSYQDAVDAGFSNILGASASEMVRAAQQYGSYQNYLDAMYEKYMGRAPTKPSTEVTKPSTEVTDPSTEVTSALPLFPDSLKSMTANQAIAVGLPYELATDLGLSNGYNKALWENSIPEAATPDAFVLGTGMSYETAERYGLTTGYTVGEWSARRNQKYPAYHSGGFVGGINDLAANEEFAKLLKGEFVVTPAQMKRFMEETLPQIANYSATGGSNEFNAPLIEIRCESVTTETLPELERVVNDAVREIKKQLDSGMSRTGYKRTPTKRLT